MKTISLDEAEQSILRRLAERVAGAETAPLDQEAGQRRILLEVARRVIKFGRWRVNLFDRAMLGEPAYDLLLALYVAEEDLGHVTATQLAECADVAQSSAQRWIDYLVGKQLVERSPHRHDKRSSVHRLSAKGRAALDELFLELMKVAKVGEVS